MFQWSTRAWGWWATLSVMAYFAHCLCKDNKSLFLSQVGKNATAWTWRHSFVNADETKQINALRSDVFLHVSMTPVEKTKLHVVAEFLSQHRQPPFLDDYVDSRNLPCHKKGQLKEHNIFFQNFFFWVCNFAFRFAGLISWKRISFPFWQKIHTTQCQLYFSWKHKTFDRNYAHATAKQAFGWGSRWWLFRQALWVNCQTIPWIGDVQKRPGLVNISYNYHSLWFHFRADNPNGLLPLVLFVVLLSLVTAGLTMLVCFRNHRQQVRVRRYLLPNMEVPVINPISDAQLSPTRPYTDGEPTFVGSQSYGAREDLPTNISRPDSSQVPPRNQEAPPEQSRRQMVTRVQHPEMNELRCKVGKRQNAEDLTQVYLSEAVVWCKNFYSSTGKLLLTKVEIMSCFVLLFVKETLDGKWCLCQWNCVLLVVVKNRTEHRRHFVLESPFLTTALAKFAFPVLMWNMANLDVISKSARASAFSVKVCSSLFLRRTELSFPLQRQSWGLSCSYRCKYSLAPPPHQPKTKVTWKQTYHANKMFLTKWYSSPSERPTFPLQTLIRLCSLFIPFPVPLNLWFYNLNMFTPKIFTSVLETDSGFVNLKRGISFLCFSHANNILLLPFEPNKNLCEYFRTKWRTQLL